MSTVAGAQGRGPAGPADARRRSGARLEAVQHHPERSGARRHHLAERDDRDHRHRVRHQRRRHLDSRRQQRLRDRRQPDRQRLLQDHARPQGLGVHGEGRLHRQRSQPRRPADAGRPDARDHHRTELRAARRAGPARVVREPGLRREAAREGRHADRAGRQLRGQALQRPERHRDQVGRRDLHRRQRRRPARRRQKPAQADAEPRLALEGREGDHGARRRRNSAPAPMASCSRSTRSFST